MFRGVEPISVLNGATASEERFKLEAPGKRLLHVATHGYFLEDRCAASAGENPLLFSGLVLAGANAAVPATGQDSIDDGILTAEEVAALDLRGVDLAVLSACDTGRGQVRVGEGVLGLRRSLELAGVRSILMSVWPVPDRQARRWMTSFYESLLTGSTVPDAARLASLASLERLRRSRRPPHPYFWGGFVTSGDWQAAGAPSPAAPGSSGGT
jgi:CHAT domain-containing protein